VSKPTDLPANFDRDAVMAQLALMHRIRAFELTAIAALKEGLVLGAIHPSIGQEGIAAGVVTQLRRDDILLSTHRGHGHTLAKGARSQAMMNELIGREGGCCSGKGGSMHIADFEVGMLGANGVVGANIVIAAGAAHAIKLKDEDKIVCCIFGDGAINRGPFMEGLNWAKVFGLPIVFVCEDNGFAATTRTESMTAGGGPAERAKALGLPSQTVDGNEVLSLTQIAKETFARVRATRQPEFLHVRTYRLTGHTASDPAAYRSAEEVEAKRADDPITRLQETLRVAGVAQATIAATEQAAFDEMNTVLATARDTPFPAPLNAYSDVQDIGNPQQDAY
jgi:TPP-dependent pyruvate/acetoin dehydrogenase alpha subunit